MILRSPQRGRPLHILLLVLAGWIGLRIETWTPPQWRTPPVAAMEWPSFALFSQRDSGDSVLNGTPNYPSEGFARGPVSYAALAERGMANETDMLAASALNPAQMLAMMAYSALPPGGPPPPADYYRMPRYQTVPVYYAAGGGIMPGTGQPALTPAVWLADNGSPPRLPGGADIGLGGAPIGLTGQSAPEAPAPIPLSPGRSEGTEDRWSADMWMLARKESPLPMASGRPVYGGSQAGAVLRYRIAPESGHRPLAYLRASTAMGAVRESEIALGVGARPLAGIPIVVAAEARGFRSASGRKSFRPAALAYTELPPFALPMGFNGEAYLQGGYVSGTYKTAFIDGQFRADRKIAQFAGARVRLGVGVWGGAQKGASRLDVGPGASAMVNIWGAPSRVSLDWRFRLLGDAEPKSGPALTISSGF